MKDNKFPYEQLAQIGVNRDTIDGMKKEEREALFQGKPSSIMNLTISKNDIDFIGKGKISLYEKPGGEIGVKVHPVRAEIKNEYNLSPKQFERLKEGETVLHDTVRDGKSSTYLLQADKQTNEVRFTEVLSVKIPDKIQGYVLQSAEKNMLKQGQKVEFQNEKGERQSIKLDLIAPKGIKVDPVVLSKDNSLKQDQSFAVSR
ncbi:DUF4099 domain-containing protein [Persicobacter diffluens]|uniref:DUF4099 domain-containing protein n=1 Tax=Persicobacter diffluens TaxID=981 RepID=A0AAN4W4V6_9BACT|nr:hypothetical protein PEDI_52350 [Persicobacter diffluens]